MSVKLLTEHYLAFLSLKGGCTGSSESTLVKMPHCWESHVTAHLLICVLQVNFEKEPRERYIQLLGYDKTDLAEKVGAIISP